MGGTEKEEALFSPMEGLIVPFVGEESFFILVLNQRFIKIIQ